MSNEKLDAELKAMGCTFLLGEQSLTELLLELRETCESDEEFRQLVNKAVENGLKKAGKPLEE